MNNNNTSVSAVGSGIEEEDEDSTVTRRALVGSILSLLIVWTLLGNLTVCLAVFRYRHLRHKVTNVFIVSLALSDLLVAVLVMPWRAVTEVAGFWPFGAFCDTWVACDIMCSTASILNLCMISVDRYWAISSPFSYERSMNRRVAAIMIAVTWTVSVVISFVPVHLNWHRRADIIRDLTGHHHNNSSRTLGGGGDGGDAGDLLLLGNCDTRLSRTYAISSSLVSFYIPVAIMIVTYTRIYGIAQLQIRRISSLERAAEHAQNCRSGSDASGTLSPDDLTSPPPQLNAHHHHHNHHHHPRRHRSLSLHSSHSYPHAAQSHRALKYSIRKETKVLKTLSIIMGVFVFCWFPFFVLNCALPFCPSGEESPGDDAQRAAAAGPHCVSETTFDVFVWFGWSNSSLNPIIYAFNADFRDAFLRLLGCRSGGGGGGSKGGRWVSGAAAEGTGGVLAASNDFKHNTSDNSSLNTTTGPSGVASCCVNSRGSRTDSSGTITVSLFYNSSRDQVVMMMDTLDKANGTGDTTSDKQTELPV